MPATPSPVTIDITPTEAGLRRMIVMFRAEIVKAEDLMARAEAGLRIEGGYNALSHQDRETLEAALEALGERELARIASMRAGIAECEAGLKAKPFRPFMDGKRVKMTLTDSDFLKVTGEAPFEVVVTDLETGKDFKMKKAGWSKDSDVEAVPQ